MTRAPQPDTRAAGLDGPDDRDGPRAAAVRRSSDHGTRDAGCDRADTAGFVAKESPARRRLSRYWLGVIWLLEVAFLFGAAELVASFYLPPGHHYRDPQMLMEPDARRIYYHQPNQRAFTIDKPFITNALGFRDEREVPADKGGEFRILTLGDSITVGLGVTAEDTYARQLESMLGHQALGPIRVLNGAVTCYGTWQEVDVLKETSRLVQPDLVILAFYWNDLYPKPDVIVPIADAKSITQDDAAHRSLRIFKRSRALLFLRERWAALSNRLWPSFDWTHRAMIAEGRTSPYLEQAYRDVEHSLTEFAALRGEGFEPLLVILPIPSQVQQPDEPATPMQRRIEAMARRAGVRTLDVLPALRQAYAEQPDLYIPWDYEHFTPRGHRVVAEALRRYLLDERLVPGSARETAAALQSR